MQWKSFNQIVKELNERGAIQIPNGYVTGDEVEKWLRDESKGKLYTEDWNEKEVLEI